MFPSEIIPHLADPIRFAQVMWPNTEKGKGVVFYDKQVEIIRSVEDTPETFVVAGNQLGKDYVAGFIVVWTFMKALMTGNTCRIVTTSVEERHLDILWGEINRFLTTSRFPLIAASNAQIAAGASSGPLVLNHMEITRATERARSKDCYNYVKGIQAKDAEKLAGHHAEMTLFVADEASALRDEHFAAAQGWAKRKLIFGNPEPTTNIFRKAVKRGNILAP